MEERFVELCGVAPAAIRAYATLTLVRHVYLSTLFPERRPFTQSLIELCEARLGVTRHVGFAGSKPTSFKKASVGGWAVGDARRRPRIALYSHDTQGLGHIRRNLLVARALCARGESPIILLLSGVREAAAFSMPPGVDCVTLPSLGKSVDGRYFPRSLDVPMADLIKVRSSGITAVLRSFDADVLSVDKGPQGVFGELLPEGGSRPITLCLVGGGRDGLTLAEAFLRAKKPGTGVVVTGPLMPPESRASLRLLAAQHPRTHVLEFVTNPCPLLERADRVVAMGGYNTICEILAYRKPALVVPRTEPRTEQLIRAARFAALGLVDMLRPSDLSPEAISAWLAAKVERPTAAEEMVDFSGVRRLPELLEEVLAAQVRAGRRPLQSVARQRLERKSDKGSREPFV